MSDTEPPVGGGRTAGAATKEARPSSEAANTPQSTVGNQLPPIQFIAVIGVVVTFMFGVVAFMFGIWTQVNRTEDALRALITEKSASLSADIKEAINKSSNDVNEARQRFLDAVTKLTDTHEKLGETVADVAQIRNQLDSSAEKIPALTSSLAATETKLANTDTRLNTTIDSFDKKLASIKIPKSHEDRHVESFGVTPGSFYSGTVNGRIIAFPLAPKAAAELDARNFTKTRARLEGTEIYAWLPPRRPANNLPKVLSLSILTAPLNSPSPQNPPQLSAHPQENQPSPEPGGSR
ncbi:MAG TPA: hypothetical protein VN838_07395 [Bradyrhizobium sp.]|nr:hypothetical protein [Bradyrhizobium sp.]